jgi:PHS family inorganic phosphate transporter-like MFS transporter
MTGFKSGGKTPWSYPAHIFSNFSIQYNFGSISIALLVMSRDVCTSTAANCLTGVQAGWVTGTSNGVSLAGAVVGQMSMGYVGDVIGRSNALLMTNSLALVSAFCSAVFPSGSPENIYSLIILFRFFLGIGLGGIYPLSATKAST